VGMHKVCLKGATMASIQNTTPAGASTPVSASATPAAHNMEDIRDQASELGVQVREKAQELGSKAQELGTQATEIAAEYYQQGREQALALEQAVEAQIRDKPIQSLLIAGGLGLLIGFLWRRR
jgi:ElaB/YqjD/DUF883 family membrane-anchored ribosome-binding protein